MRRGAVVVAAAKGAYSGKPRPAVVIQGDLLNPTHSSVILLPITSELRDLPGFRVPVQPSETNGLQQPSEIMVDKPITIPTEKINRQIGMLDADTMSLIDRALAIVVGLV